MILTQKASWLEDDLGIKMQSANSFCRLCAATQGLYPTILMSSVGYKDCSDKQKSDSLWSGCNTELFAELK